jgi:hypothetical protein
VTGKACDQLCVASVPQTDTGGRGEKPQVIEITFVKELGKKSGVTSG